ncbi:MAG: hypothetical protein Q4F01_04835 [Staphylococcus rostri]|uniref:putative PEP-binding protein n=1 Tax=Staphylococcus rostri TaxID=522262 RepID=UPI0026E0DA88|nr:putative PEP-binding protein [Staphylococcus rostri]MDO5375494.1 hypothetical protein [Staphylococcus rostri]
MENIVKLLEAFSKNKIQAEELLEHITEKELNTVLNSNFKSTKNTLLLTQGEPINSGDVSGYLVTDKHLAKILFSEAKKRNTNINVIYSPINGDITDFANIRDSSGFFTRQKGSTTFCSLQASCEGKPTIGSVDCNYITTENRKKKMFEFSDGSTVELEINQHIVNFNGMHILREGDDISISGKDGKTYKGIIESEMSLIGKIYSVLATIIVEFKNNSNYKSIDETPTYQLNEKFLLNGIKTDVFKGFQKLIKYCYKKAGLKIYSTSHTSQTLAYSGLIASDISCLNNKIHIRQRKVDFGLGLLRDERIWDGVEEIDLLRLVFLGEKINKDNYKEIKKEYVSVLSNKLYNVFKIGTGNIAVVRLLCMPLTMLFNQDFDIDKFSKTYDLDIELVSSEILSMSGEKEVYHGFRGVRVTVHRKDIAELWCEAVIRAAQRVESEGSLERLQLLLSMVTLPQEVASFMSILNKTINKLQAQNIIAGVSIMVETAGAYILIEDFLKIHEDHIKLNGLLFGGNDFTAACLNMNRSDSASTIIPTYIREKLFDFSPFQSLNTQLVGKAIKDILEKVGKSDDYLIGLGGEIAGDWDSVQWLTENDMNSGLDYISTPPNRMIFSLIASAKATMKI